MELKLIYQCIHKKNRSRLTRSITRTVTNLDDTTKEVYNVYYKDKRELEKDGYQVESVQEKME
jgi:hypothetical protein